MAVPAKQYVAPGQMVAYDDEQLTVNLLRMFSGQPGAETDVVRYQLAVQSAEIQVVLVRQTPVLQDDGTAPPVESMQASAVENFADAAALRQVLEDMKRDYAIGTRAAPVSIGPVTTIGPEGGVVGVAAVVAVVVS